MIRYMTRDRYPLTADKSYAMGREDFLADRSPDCTKAQGWESEYLRGYKHARWDAEAASA